jgi:hypothetical protein
VASPLGLRVIVGAEGEEGRDFDFLASVEILVLDQADIFLMQVECSTSSHFPCTVMVHEPFISSVSF